MEKSELSRKEREKLRRKEDILLAAQKCFARKGFHECTMEDVAREYQCAVGSLYNYFGGKDQIYQAIFEMHAENNMEFTKNLVFDMSDPKKAISDYILARLEYGYENQEFIKMFLRNKMNENFADESHWYENVLPSMQSLWAVLKEILEAGIETGVIRADLNVVQSQRMLEYQIYRVMDETCMKKHFEPDEELTLEQYRDEIIDVFFYGICEKKRKVL